VFSLNTIEDMPEQSKTDKMIK